MELKKECQMRKEMDFVVKKNCLRQTACGSRTEKQTPTQKERGEHEAAHVPFRAWCTHCTKVRERAHPPLRWTATS